MRNIILFTCLVQIGLGVWGHYVPSVDELFKLFSLVAYTIVAVGACMESKQTDVEQLTEKLIDTEKELLKTEQNGKPKKHPTAH
jgi:hypothetical protein